MGSLSLWRSWGEADDDLKTNKGKVALTKISLKNVSNGLRTGATENLTTEPNILIPYALLYLVTNFQVCVLLVVEK